VSLNIPTGSGEPSASIQIEAYAYEGS